MSMAHSLEVRVPFVDHQLLDAVWPDLGAHPALMRNKRLLHETLARPLPRAAVDRPKQGFTLPFARWIGGELQPFVRSGMAYLAEAGWMAPGVPDATWSSWKQGAIALEPAVGARRPRRVPEAGLLESREPRTGGQVVTSPLLRARRHVGALRRRLFEPPEKAAWRRACRQAETTPRFTPGTIRLMDYDAAYSDLLSLCPQWHDIFVKRVARFRDRLRVAAHPGLRRQCRTGEPVLQAPISGGAHDGLRSGSGALRDARRQPARRTARPTSKRRTRRCGRRPARLTLPLRRQPTPAWSTRSRAPSTAGRRPCRASGSGRCSSESAIDLLKLDIEGAEHAVLADCEPVLHRVRAHRDGPARVRSGGAPGAARARAACRAPASPTPSTTSCRCRGASRPAPARRRFPGGRSRGR